jgi:HrpA-like RNA helicase
MQLEAIPPGSAFTITPVGRQMLHFPINPLLAKVLIASFDLGCTREIIDIIALREAGNPILESHDKRELADKTRRAFVHRDGDHLTGMNVFRGFLETLEQARRDNASASAADKSVRKAVLDWCDKNSLSFRVLYEAKQLRTQLEQLVRTVGQDPDVSAGQNFSSVMQCLTKGLYMNAARLQPDGKSYQPVLNRISHEVSLIGGSGVVKAAALISHAHHRMVSNYILPLSLWARKSLP